MGSIFYPKPDILADTALEQGHAVIEASAGTGKTYTLEHLVIDLIIKHKANIEEVLVVTFTDAATRELRERVRSLIRDICDTKVKGSATPQGYCWELEADDLLRLREALFRFDGAAISTIHGFCHRILSEQAFLGGRLFEQEQADGAEMFGYAFREEIRVVLAEEGEAGAMLRGWLEVGNNKLSDLQGLLYACHREGCPERTVHTPPWDVQGFLAGLGSLPPEEKLLMAVENYFSEKKERNSYKKFITDIYKVINDINATDDWQEKVNLLSAMAIKKKTINKQDSTYSGYIRLMGDMDGISDTIKDFSAVFDELLSSLPLVESFFVAKLLPRIQSRLTARKNSLGLMDFDDMLLGVMKALKGPSGPSLISTLRKRWKYALVDEFQDTDPVQWEIFRLIFADDSQEHRLFVIGDPKQAIYGFRGADVHTYDAARKHLIEDKDAANLPLLRNFRSTEKMIQGVNAVLTAMDENGDAFFSGLNRYDEPVQCGDPTRFARDNGKPAVPVHLLRLYAKEGDKLNAEAVKYGMGCFVAEEVLRLTNPKTALYTGSEWKEKAPVKLSDIYILTRSGVEGLNIGNILRRYGIPHAFFKMDGLFKGSEASSIYHLLRAVESPLDPAARMLAWLTPFFGIPLGEISEWSRVSENHPFMERLFRWNSLTEERKWARLFDDVLSSSGLVRRLILLDEERSLTNYLHLFEILLEETHTHPVTLRELARNLKARIDGRKLPEGREGDMQRLETDRESVQILTMHKAKGLEAEVVFIAGGLSNFPGSNLHKYHLDGKRYLHIGKTFGAISEAVNREEDEESQRLAYVALTRAKSRLYLPYFDEADDSKPEKRKYAYASLGNFYRGLQKQFDLLRENNDLEPSLFEMRDVLCKLELSEDNDSPHNYKVDGEKELILEPLLSRAKDVEKIKPGRRGILLTSYTRMKRGESWQPPVLESGGKESLRGDEVEGEEAQSLGEPDGPGPGSDPGLGAEWKSAGLPAVHDLPGGVNGGIFIHAMLEDIPFDEIKGLSFEEWSSDEAVRERTSKIAKRYGVEEVYLDAALQMSYAALRMPLSAKSLEEQDAFSMPGGIASGSHYRTEMEFAYPIPENFHPLLAERDNNTEAFVTDAETGGLSYRALRGYIQGFIDLVFEHEGKIYLLDWKSDRMPSYERGTLNSHIENNYKLQSRVYILALVRFLNIYSREDYESQFGGVLYLFTRGLAADVEPGLDNDHASDSDLALDGGRAGDTPGVWFSLPPWSEVCRWEQDMVGHNEWGGPVIETGKPGGGIG